MEKKEEKIEIHVAGHGDRFQVTANWIANYFVAHPNKNIRIADLKIQILSNPMEEGWIFKILSNISYVVTELVKATQEDPDLIGGTIERVHQGKYIFRPKKKEEIAPPPAETRDVPTLTGILKVTSALLDKITELTDAITVDVVACKDMIKRRLEEKPNALFSRICAHCGHIFTREDRRILYCEDCQKIYGKARF